MSKPIVMFDIDGVLADFVLGFTTKAHELFPEVPITKTVDQPRWDGFPGMDDKQIDRVWRWISKNPEFWYSLLPFDTDLFYRLNDISGDIYFTTNRKDNAKLTTETWLETWGVESPTVILCKRKGEVARAIGATHMIDDKAGNAIYTAYHSAGTKAFILDRPYNQFDAEVIGSKVTRVKTVEEYLEKIWNS